MAMALEATRAVYAYLPIKTYTRERIASTKILDTDWKHRTSCVQRWVNAQSLLDPRRLVMRRRAITATIWLGFPMRWNTKLVLLE
jgi:hypothetical protein